MIVPTFHAEGLGWYSGTHAPSAREPAWIRAWKLANDAWDHGSITLPVLVALPAGHCGFPWSVFSKAVRSVGSGGTISTTYEWRPVFLSIRFND